MEPLLMRAFPITKMRNTLLFQRNRLTGFLSLAIANHSVSFQDANGTEAIRCSKINKANVSWLFPFPTSGFSRRVLTRSLHNSTYGAIVCLVLFRGVGFEKDIQGSQRRKSY